MRVAHLSDLHFTKVTRCPLQFFSKEWIGNFNWMLFRRKEYSTEHLEDIVSILKANGVEKVLFTGDYVTTAQILEFEMAKEFVSKSGLSFLSIPGNHDVYTKKSDRLKLFYHYFPDEMLKSKRVSSHFLGENWWWIGLDTTLPTPPFTDFGIFSKEMEVELEKTLQSLPKDSQIILGAHHPLYFYKNERHGLKGREKLLALLQNWPSVKLYLHGHDHTPRQDKIGHLTTLCSGSASKKIAPSFSILDLKDDFKIEMRFQDVH